MRMRKKREKKRENYHLNLSYLQVRRHLLSHQNLYSLFINVSYELSANTTVDY